MTKTFCDNCEKDITENPGLGNIRVSLGFWGCERNMTFCTDCGLPVLKKLGFGYDTGQLLSESRGEYIAIDGSAVLVQHPEKPLAKIK